MASCAPQIPEKSPTSYSDAELLIVYGNSIKHSSDTPQQEALDKEVRSRGLLSSSREVDAIRNTILGVGTRSAVVLAALGEPHDVVLFPNGFPYWQVWRYILYAPFRDSVTVVPTERHPIRWTDMPNQNDIDWETNVIFVNKGKIIGLAMVAKHKENDNGIFLQPYRLASSGTTFPTPFGIFPPLKRSNCLTGGCLGLSIP